MNWEQVGNPPEESNPRRMPLLSTFIETSQSHRFRRCAKAVGEPPYRGRDGEAGVGKTRSAGRLPGGISRETAERAAGEVWSGDKIAFYTPEATMSPKRLEQDLLYLHAQMKRIGGLTPPLMRAGETAW